MSHEHAPKPAAVSPIVELTRARSAKARGADQVPTARALLEGDSPVVLDGVDAPALRKAIEKYADQVFKGLSAALAFASKGLSQPRKPPEPSIALALMAELVGALAELALGYVTGGLVSAAKATLHETAFAALKDTTHHLSTQAGTKLGQLFEQHAHQGGAGGESGGRKPVHHWVNPSAKTLVEEFVARQQLALEHRHTHVQVTQIVGAIAHATAGELRDLAVELDRLDIGELTGEFQAQIALGWMGFCTRASLGEEAIEGGASNVALAPQLAPHGQQNEVEGAIDVNVRVPDVVDGVRSLALIGMVSDFTASGAATTLSHMRQSLMTAPVMRRIWLVFDKGGFGQANVMVIYPDGTLRFDHGDRYLVGIGKMIPLEHSELGDTNPTFAMMGAQMLLDWLRPLTLESLT